MLVLKGQPDGRVERRLNKNWFVKNIFKKIFAYCQLKAWNNQTIKKVNEWGLEKILSLCIEERNDFSDGWCINTQNW